MSAFPSPSSIPSVLDFLAVKFIDPNVIAQHRSDSDSEADSVTIEAPCGSAAATSNWIPVITDLWPAVMTTIPPAEATGPVQWRAAVKDVMAAFKAYQQSSEPHIKEAAGYLHNQLESFYYSTGASQASAHVQWLAQPDL